MSGRALIIGLLVFTAAFAVALWYFQTRFWYERVEGVTEIEVNGQPMPVSDYRGIDATSSPLKLRACFRQDWPQFAASGALATPLTAPGWFECYDAGRITEDVAAGRAQAIRIAEDEPAGIDTWVARYPDGRAYMWRQLNEKYQD